MSESSGSANKTSAAGPPMKVEDLYREVNEWRSEHDAWLKEVDRWKREQRLIKLLLYKMERALPNQNNSLDEHTRIISKHKQRISAYEKRFRELLAGEKPCPEKYGALCEEHALQKKLHLRERERHESFRRSHLAAMSELARLTRALEKAERP